MPTYELKSAKTNRCQKSLEEIENQETDAETALREIALYMGIGGYNASRVNVKAYVAKIKEEYDRVLRFSLK